jgi:hypothetical protein
LPARRGCFPPRDRAHFRCGPLANSPGKASAVGLRLFISAEQLAEYRKDPDCEGETYRVLGLALEVEDISFDAALYARKPDALEKGQLVASDYNRVAQAAADKGCRALARSLFLKVMETYVGSGYAAMRQRAQIGIEDLRDAATRGTPETGTAAR